MLGMAKLPKPFITENSVCLKYTLGFLAIKTIFSLDQRFDLECRVRGKRLVHKIKDLKENLGNSVIRASGLLLEGSPLFQGVAEPNPKRPPPPYLERENINIT